MVGKIIGQGRKMVVPISCLVVEGEGGILKICQDQGAEIEKVMPQPLYCMLQHGLSPGISIKIYNDYSYVYRYIVRYIWRHQPFFNLSFFNDTEKYKFYACLNFCKQRS
jgi:hypothetical protein